MYGIETVGERGKKQTPLDAACMPKASKQEEQTTIEILERYVGPYPTSDATGKVQRVCWV